MTLRHFLVGKTKAEMATEEAEALERAADTAHAEGDGEHEKALRKAALFKRRLARERAAGFDGWPVCAFDKI